MKKHFLYLLFISRFAIPALATDPDTNYVQTFSSLFALKGFLVQNGFTYTITPRNNPNYTVDQLKNARVIYTPYIPPTVGVALNVKGIGASYVFKVRDDFWDTLGRARSTYHQFAMNIYKIKFGFEGYYQDYRRFYFHYSDIDKLNTHHYNNDIRAYQIGMNFILMPNGKKFSYNAAFNQNVFQKKPSGSFLFMFSLKFNEIKSDNLIPDSIVKYFNGYDYTRNRNYAFMVYPGYAFNLTKHLLYFSGAIMGGVGIQGQTYLLKGPVPKDYKISFPIGYRAKVAAGYNGRVFFTGIFANVDYNLTAVHAVKMEQNIYSYGLYIGVRFIKDTKTKGQLKAEERRIRNAEKAAKKKEAEEKKLSKRKKK